MKLTVPREEILVHDVEQDSKEWLEGFRPAGIGSSDIILLVEPKGSFERNLYGLWKDRCNYEKFQFVANEHVSRGKRLEPFVRDKVNEMLNMNFEPACISRKHEPYLRVSLDGIDFEHDVLLEIKCPSDKVFEKYLDTKEVPANYYMQIQYQLLVSNADYAYYAFYNEAHKEPYIIVVENNLELQADIQKRCALFWDAVQNRIPIGFDEAGGLKLFPIRPTMVVHIGESSPVSEIPVVTEILPVEGTFIYSTNDISTISAMREKNPHHEVRIRPESECQILKS